MPVVRIRRPPRRICRSRRTRSARRSDRTPPTGCRLSGPRVSLEEGPTMAVSMSAQPTKFVLDEDQLPRAWYNIAADLPELPPPVLHQGTGQPIGPADLAALFP